MQEYFYRDSRQVESGVTESLMLEKIAICWCDEANDPIALRLASGSSIEATEGWKYEKNWERCCQENFTFVEGKV